MARYPPTGQRVCFLATRSVPTNGPPATQGTHITKGSFNLVPRRLSWSHLPGNGTGEDGAYPNLAAACFVTAATTPPSLPFFLSFLEPVKPLWLEGPLDAGFMVEDSLTDLA